MTDGGLNAIVRVDPDTSAFRGFRLPPSTGYANLNTATFDRRGILWFTGQSGIYGRLNPKTGAMRVFRAPVGTGRTGSRRRRKGRSSTPRSRGATSREINVRTGKATVIRPPTAGQGARRVWSNSKGRLWVSEWNAGQGRPLRPGHAEVARVGRPRACPALRRLRRRQGLRLADRLRAERARAFRAGHGKFTPVPLRAGADVRQLLGRPGEVWGAESGADRLVVVRRLSAKDRPLAGASDASMPASVLGGSAASLASE